MSEDSTSTPRSGDTREAIMHATYKALCEHGYADLTIQKIADEFEMTTAVLHYHYDTKEDLLAAFLEWVLNEYTDRIDVSNIEDPQDRLLALIDELLLGLDDDETSGPPFDRGRAFNTALLEMRGQAARREPFREQFTANYNLVKEMIISTINDGIEQGVFREADAEQVATLVLAAMLGGRAYDVSLFHEGSATAVREAIEELLVKELLEA